MLGSHGYLFYPCMPMCEILSHYVNYAEVHFTICFTLKFTLGDIIHMSSIIMIGFKETTSVLDNFLTHISNFRVASCLAIMPTITYTLSAIFGLENRQSQSRKKDCRETFWSKFLSFFFTLLLL